MAVSLGDLVAANVEVPTMPFVARRVRELLADPDIDAATVAAFLEADQGICTQVMRVASSSFYGAIRPANLKLAIMRIGFEETKNIALAVATKSLFKRFGPVERRHWEHSLRVAIATRSLVERYAAKFAPSAFLAGQLHDIGMILINNHAPSMYSKNASYGPSSDLALAEQAALGFTHHDIGSVVARKWELAAVFEEAAQYHDDLLLAQTVAQDHLPLLAAVAIADHVCQTQSLQKACDGEQPERVATALEMLDIPPVAYRDLAVTILETSSRERSLIV